VLTVVCTAVNVVNTGLDRQPWRGDNPCSLAE